MMQDDNQSLKKSCTQGVINHHIMAWELINCSIWFTGQWTYMFIVISLGKSILGHEWSSWAVQANLEHWWQLFLMRIDLLMNYSGSMNIVIIPRKDDYCTNVRSDDKW